ncbi:MAG TPA: hypothetical protein PL071_09060 [Nitrosomonas sp.]|nr:hypothetical protein [Nitrosomonas sp.]
MSGEIIISAETQCDTMRYDGLSADTLREIIGYKDKSIEHMGSTIESMRNRLAAKDKEISRLELKLDRIKAIVSNP